MNERVRRWLWRGGVLAAALLGVIFGYLQISRPTEIPVESVAKAPAELTLAVIGRVRARELVEVRAERPGALVELLADESDRVSQGQALARVRSGEERGALDTARAEVAAIEAEVVLAARELDRSSPLAQAGWVTRARLDRDRAALASARSRLAAARARVASQAATVGETVLRSPLDGVVLARPVDLGHVVATTETVFTIGTADRIEIEAEVDEFYADAVRVGQAAILSPAGTRERSIGRVSEVSPRVDPRSGARLVRVVPPDNSNYDPGRSVDVNVVVERLRNAISVPRASLIGRGRAQRVLVLEGERVVERAVETLDWPGERAIVRSGLQPGDLIVLDPLEHPVGSEGVAATRSGRR